jgi:hypothetical protein
MTTTPTIDIDVLGRWPRPFDVKPWIQCTFQECGKWLETEELRIKHVAKYHPNQKNAKPESESKSKDVFESELGLEHEPKPRHQIFSNTSRDFTRTLNTR